MSSRSSLSTWNRRLLRTSRGSASRPHRHVSARPPPAAAEATRALQHLEASPPRVATLVALAQNLLRSESVASSRIEVVHLSHKRLARAAYQADEGQWDRRAAEVLGNVEAMKRAIELGTAGSPLTVADIEDIHRTLLRITEDTEIAGVVRTTQNWIGGNDYNPVGASYVPPRPEHVPLLEDLCAFVNRVDLAPIVQAGIAHARAATEAERLADAIEQLRSAWLDDLGRPRSDAAVRQLVSALPQQPVIDVAAAQQLTCKSHVAVGKALQQLERVGILTRLDERKWGRVWECERLFNLVDAFEKSVRTASP